MNKNQIRRRMEAKHYTGKSPLGFIEKNDILLIFHEINPEHQYVAGMKRLPGQKLKAFVTKIRRNGYFTVNATHWKLNDMKQNQAKDIQEAVYLSYKYHLPITLTPEDMEKVIDPLLLEGHYYHGHHV